LKVSQASLIGPLGRITYKYVQTSVEHGKENTDRQTRCTRKKTCTYTTSSTTTATWIGLGLNTVLLAEKPLPQKLLYDMAGEN
jgi:hypothetical protein